MGIRLSSFRALIVGLLLLVSPSAVFTQAQNRPRTLADTTATRAQDNFAVGSPETRAEAKKAYKAGVDYGNAGLFTQAVELFTRAIQLRPDYADAYRSLGHAYYDLKDWPRAVSSLEQALELNPKDKEARKLLDLIRSIIERSGRELPNATTSKGNSGVNAVEDERALTRVYRVGPGDVLEVRFSNSPSMDSMTTTVTKSGLLELPKLSEPLKASGLTVDEIKAKLEKSLSQPVTVEVHDYVSHAIMISGLVKEPGLKIIQREAIPLSVVIADAQATPEADRAVVVRNKTGETLTIDLTSSEINFLVQPRDVVTVQQSPPQFIYVSGEVKAPGEKVYRRGLTLTQAIITAGGSSGDTKEVRIARDDGRGFLVVTRYQLKDIESGKAQDPLIKPGDRITVMN